MRRITIILLLFLISILTWFCQKRLFGKIHLKGTVIDWFTGQPIPTEGSLVAISKSSVFIPSLPFMNQNDLGSFKNNIDGSFNETIESDRSDNYFIVFSETKPQPMLKFRPEFFRKFQVGNKGTMDFGVLRDMPHVFICKINLSYTSTSTNHILFEPGKLSFVDLPPGKDTTFLIATTYGLEEYETNNHSFILGYSFTDGNTFITPVTNTISSPLGLNDTVYFNVTY